MTKKIIGTLLAWVIAAGFSGTANGDGTWASVAYCKSTGNIGYAYRHATENDAKSAALHSCVLTAVKREGMKRLNAERCCDVRFASNSTCLAIATGNDSRSTISRRNADKIISIRESMARCMKHSPYCRPLLILCGGGGKGADEANDAPGYGFGKAVPNWELR